MAAGCTPPPLSLQGSYGTTRNPSAMAAANDSKPAMVGFDQPLVVAQPTRR